MAASPGSFCKVPTSNTSGTRPIPLWRRMSPLSREAMPADSCPRCWRAWMPRYVRLADSGWPKMPNTPHSSWNLSASSGSWAGGRWTTFSFKGRSSEGDEGYRADRSPATRGKHAASLRCSSSAWGSLARRAGRRTAVRTTRAGGLPAPALASARHGSRKRERGPDRRGADEAARAVPRQGPGDARGQRQRAARVGPQEPPRDAEAPARPDHHQGVAGARPRPDPERADLEMAAFRGGGGRGAGDALLEGVPRASPDEGRERLPLRHHLVEARRS